MTDSDKERPRLVESGQGLRFLNIEYKNRFLYSKYDPFRSIRGVIESLSLLEGTLVVICSPGLFYGIDELKRKLPENTFLIAVEADDELAQISENCEIRKDNSEIPLFRWSQLELLDEYVRKLCRSGKCRRAVRIDFCAGSAFSPDKYSVIMAGLTDIIGGFWKNRITLVRMGRMFSRNVFRNIGLRRRSPVLDDVSACVKKDILVVGAGESLDSFMFWDEVKAGSFFVIAVDAALIPLKERGIECDAVVSLESQSVIDSFYVGVKKSEKTVLFADLCSRNEVCMKFKKRVFFLSEYSPGPFIDSIKEKNVAGVTVPPLGSVGLAAVYIALRLRKDEGVNVFTVGLDFSFSVGATHSKNAPAHIQRLFCTDRKRSVENYDAVFSGAGYFTSDKNNNPVCTTKILSMYAAQFKNEFSGAANLYDAGKSGLDLGLQRADDDFIRTRLNYLRSDCSDESCIPDEVFRTDFPLAVEFLNDELEDLETAASLLSEGEESVFRDSSLALEKQIRNLLEKKDYLYLHFPDGFEFNSGIQFLKRLKAEILFFIKQCKISIQNSV
ncbi:DUF115 domain-containing protein [Treponema rectale]|uniref:DUF115 domain-containing protein n=1 Tax=Treponema rectale TaxID=744512 RepID=A0A840SAS8_9SPIR|nr:6-hydroxymethylpterin diphosphokinase MptE-like protein [Treponema rectale]MBB5217905.1 hypothetical protein [Treponema rectale]QOS40375.1 DUF115 domain-containing protein [Treponema rectale]